MKKLTAFLLSLLLCLSLLPGQVRAAGQPESPEPPVVEESMDSETPEEPVLLMADVPERDNNSHTSN